jgi:hypothetical protein
MRIGCDLDGVLADLHRAFADAALQAFPEIDPQAVAAPDVGASPPVEPEPSAAGQPEAIAPPHEADKRKLPLTGSQVDSVWSTLCATPDFWESLREIEPGIIGRLAELADAHQWEVLFLTSRPPAAGRTVQRQSQRWLERCGFPLPSVYVVHGSRGRIADALALDVVIDDRADNCLDVVLESKARAILVWRGDATSVPRSARRLGIGVAPTVAACLEVLVEAGRTADAGDGFMQRLRRLLGLQTHTKGPFGSAG